MSRFDRIAVVIVTLAVFAAPSSAQPRPLDPIAEARARANIADQKARQDVIEALQAAERQAKTNPIKAAQLLKAAQSNIDLSAGISGEARRTLTASIQNQLNILEGRAVRAPAAPAPKADPNGPVVRADRQAAIDRYLAEIKAVREGLDQIKAYQAKNDQRGADRVVAELTAKYPDNPGVIALSTKEAMGSALSESRQINELASKRVLLALNDVQRSDIPPLGDIEFPKDWKSRDHRKDTGPKLTEKEESLLRALDQPMTVNFANRPLEEALQDVSNAMNQPLFLDVKSLTDLGLDLKKPITLQAKGVQTRTVLRQILAGEGLTFVVRDQAIQVVTVEKAREMLVTRVYYLGDVVQGGPFSGSLTWGPLVDYQQTMANVGLIIDSIQNSVDPMSWRDKGGPGTITFHFPSMSIIVRASTEVQATLGSKFSGRK